MKTPRLILMCVLLALGLSAFGQSNLQALPISAVNTSSTGVAPSAGSFLTVALSAGQNACYVDLSGTYQGQLHVAVKYPGAPTRILPDALLLNFLAGGTGIAPNAQGVWTFSVNGPGTLYLQMDTYTSGSASGVLACGPGRPQGGTSLSPVAFSAATLPLPTNGAQESGGNLALLGGAVASNKVKVGKAVSLLGAASGATNGSVAAGAHLTSRLIGQNASSSTLYLMIFDATSLPSNGTAPIAQVMVSFGITAAPTENVRQFGEDWVANTTGLWYAWSTTSGTLTLAGSGTGLGSEVYGG